MDQSSNVDPHLGLFSLETLCVRLAHDRSELAFGPAPPYSEAIKTFVHETKHHFDVTTTPFGLFSIRLRRAQSLIVSDLIHLLRVEEAPKTLPLLRAGKGLPPSKRSDYDFRVRHWFELELVYRYLMGEIVGPALDQIATPLPLESLAHHFSSAMELMRRFAAFERQGPLLPAGEWDFQKDASAQELMLGVEFLSQQMNTPAVFEAGALAWQLILEDHSTVADVLSRLERIKAIRSGPHGALLWGLSRVRTTSAATALRTLAAVSEFALFGPLLAHHPTERVTLMELIPYWRWRTALDILPRFAPVRELGDQARLVAELCDASEWWPPSAIMDADVNAPPFDADPLEALYLRAQQRRRSRPHDFSDIGLLLGVSEDAIAFRSEHLNFPVIEYRDVTVFHPNKDLLEAMIMGYLFHRALRQMMVRRRVVIDAPYALLPGESARLSRELTEYLELALGIRVRGVSVVSRRS